MKKAFWLLALAAVLIPAFDAVAGKPQRAARQAAYFSGARPWNGDYAYTPDGGPVALVIPPHADTSMAWGWGVTASEMRPNWHQFGRYQPPGFVAGPQSPFLPTPLYPSHTDQFGVYPVRGPWR
jgi:hypothetical protein